MHKVLRKTLACFVANLLLVSSLALAQNSSEKTRPRRAETQTQTATPSSSQEANVEPLIRIGLSTDARSVSITTRGRLMYALSETGQAESLQFARVRLE